MAAQADRARRSCSWSLLLLLFFFIELGANLDMGTIGAQTGAAIVFSLFVLIGNPLIVMAIMGYMGYRRRTGFLAGLTQLFGGHETMSLVADNQWRMPFGQSIQAQCGILQHGMFTDQRQQLLRVKFT